MHTTVPAQSVPPSQMVDKEAPNADSDDPRQAGEEAARAVARMRHRAIDNWDQVAHFTQAALAENGLSYRDQETHTGVGASTVYRMALGSAVGVRAVQQFAAFAAQGSRQEETRAFWAATLSRFNLADKPDIPTAVSPEKVAALYAQLTRPESRKAVTDLLHALQASEAAR